jgi:hypothetical protein
VQVTALGVTLHFSAPRDPIGWLLLVVLIAFAAQRGATVFFGSGISAFFGTLVATPLAYLVHLRFTRGRQWRRPSCRVPGCCCRAHSAC